ncbi:drug/metabolite transporter (DMT)-like permease [Nocardia transvalensis]|uniref:Drug/metabolite transporter (DMT)-like permease n=1 Tax=Nocardia transvalensis TaxID=37333 RepID=A0A7W9PIL9_9NOCA|nr:DMT family transporter [Nocardia transvalensis]MBB5916393.1 drug/metabolite transporter (DMT)-like permease [Nocardia transvalensis]
MTELADPPSRPTAQHGGADVASAVAALVAVVLWASAFVAIRDAGPHLSPAPMALLRLVVAAAALTIPVFARRRPLDRIPRSPRALLLVTAYAVLWLAGYTVALNTAELHVDAGTAALLVNLAPLLVAFGAAGLFGELLTRALLLGAGVSLAGVAIIAVSSGGGHRDGLGVLLCVLAAVLYAAGVLVQKPALRYVDPLTAIWLGCVIGTVALLPWTPQLISELSAAPARVIADGIYLGLFPTALGFTAWSYALHRTAASRLTASTYAVPALSILLSWVLLAEIPTAWGLLGGAVCLLGVALSRRAPR